MKICKITGITVFLAAVLFFSGGCVGEISVDRVGFDGRLEYNNGRINGISPETANIMANFLLTQSYEDDPQEFIMRFQTIFANEPMPEYLAALADSALSIGISQSNDPDSAVRYFLSAAIYSYAYLVGADRPAEEPYSDIRMRLIRIYNVATGEVFDYLRRRHMHLTEGYSLTAVGGQRITFRLPEFDIPVRRDQIGDIQLCSGYRPLNLTHISRRFGIGEPVIAEVCNTVSSGDIRFADNLTIPLTLTIGFGWVDRENGKLDARMFFTDSRNRDAVEVGHYSMPLQLDYSTPLAYMVRNPLPFGYLEYMLRPDKTRAMQGLYLFEPYRDDRIPVVFVHGLMSDTRTWMQMINTLWNTPDIRRNYQFCGFTYSSGNPVLLSAKMLRDDLAEARRQIGRAHAPRPR
ncbi:MAG: hypothetical protein PHI35_07485 [Victivallaceae bacterium]|nr:hypothetical protein [Victivallaceae bacterium]